MSEDQDNIDKPLFQISIDPANSYPLRNAASWARVLGVCGIIFGTILSILGVISLIQFSRYSYGNVSQYNRPSWYYMASGGGPAGFTLIVFIITGSLFIIGGIFSYIFGKKVVIALHANDVNALNSAFTSLRNYYALRSIVLMVILLLILIFIILAV